MIFGKASSDWTSGEGCCQIWAPPHPPLWLSSCHLSSSGAQKQWDFVITFWWSQPCNEMALVVSDWNSVPFSEPWEHDRFACPPLLMLWERGPLIVFLLSCWVLLPDQKKRHERGFSAVSLSQYKLPVQFLGTIEPVGLLEPSFHQVLIILLPGSEGCWGKLLGRCQLELGQILSSSLKWDDAH